MDREVERLKGDVEEQETLLGALRSEEEKANVCLQDISLMDSYLVSLFPRMCSMGGGRRGYQDNN